MLSQAISLINNVSFAKGAVLKPGNDDIRDIAALLEDLGVYDNATMMMLIYGPVPSETKNSASYKALYQKLESIPILQMSDEPQRGGRY